MSAMLDYDDVPGYAKGCWLYSITEELMNQLIKDAKLRTKMFVHPEMVEKFLVVLAYAYKQEVDEALEIADEIGLNKKHMKAIGKEFEALEEEVEEDFREQAKWGDYDE